LSPKQRGAKSGALAHDSGPAEPFSAPSDLPPVQHPAEDMADLARRLAALPEAVRAQIVAMVKAGGKGRV